MKEVQTFSTAEDRLYTDVRTIVTHSDGKTRKNPNFAEP